MQSDGQVVHNSTGDADTMIVANALRIATEGKKVNVVADDTDVYTNPFNVRLDRYYGRCIFSVEITEEKFASVENM